MDRAVTVSTEGGVRRLTLSRPERYNTITPRLRDELRSALLDAAAEDEVRVILLDAEGPAFCAGYELGSSTAAQAGENQRHRVWDSEADLRMIGSYAETWSLLHTIPKPTLASVSGWCLAGGTNMVLHADIIIAAESARFGYPPMRVWGIPEAPWIWIARLGVQRARRYLLTGDELTGAEAAEFGLALECVPDTELAGISTALAQRIARLPLNQLRMITTSINQTVRHMYDPETSRLIGSLFDGVARHTQEGMDFVARAADVGFREAVRERDRPFGDYGERNRPANDAGTEDDVRN